MSFKLEILLSWAVFLSPYPEPATAPEVQIVPPEFFHEHACGGKECDVIGWYNDQGIVYFHEDLDPNSMLGRSIAVHELVHYLQHLSGKYVSNSCEDSIERELEAYRVQNEYLIAHGTKPRKVMPAGCNKVGDDGKSS